MSSSQVIDSEKRIRQLDTFFAQQTREKYQKAQTSALEARKEVLQDAQQNPGKMLSHVEIAARLTKMNPSLIFERSLAYPDQGGIYVRQDGANADDLNPLNRNRRFVTGMAWGMCPEHTVIATCLDEHGEPHPRVTVKGWRDTLKVLIQARLVTLMQVEKAFGSSGKNWHQQLH